MADEEYVSFENALRDLRITADQLKRLVSEGEIRAIRGEHNTMRFRKDEIERLKQDTSKTLPEASSETLTDDLLFDEGEDKGAEEGASTVQLKPSAPAAKPGQKPPAKPAPASARAAGRPTPPKASPESRPVTPVRRTTSRSAPREGGVADPSGIGAGSVVALVACTLVMLFTTFVLLDMAEDKLTSVTEGIAKMATPKELKGG